jgi:hypothetical protein
MTDNKPENEEVLDESQLEIVDSPQQTWFAEEQPIFTDILNTDAPSLVVEVKTKRHPLLILLIIVPIALVVLVAVLMMSRGGVKTPVQFAGPNEASASAKIRPDIERRLRLVETDVENADPIEPQLAFPPISFELDLEDASVRQKNLRRR